jgi:hypothetical protein
MLQAPNGQPYLLGSVLPNNPVPGTAPVSDWRSLLLVPIELPSK